MNNMVSLESVLRLYFNFERIYNEAHRIHLEKYYKSVSKREMFKVKNKAYNIQARMGYVGKLKNKTMFWMYVADLNIRKKGERRANVPLHSMPDCEYMFYGMYMNCFAFLMDINAARLVLIHSSTSEKIEFKYKPKMAKELLDHYSNNNNSINQTVLDL